ncbi:hypothetical protein TraAM80_03553 [Trypanosoma rangeli]|uniref:COPI associated protein n=1 Tax=Trypanosoma rangeli TaxID=5698 RepID=A0A3R7M187_TRYRA|nr:uncharacterized protein TraAM80_03553 [Trypanosoma rangeli]RNF07181.1 hypothetical protein TraAM80_03553 [Trypanosoma rangeli]|eukprot:RNF07181.1 hypothetical protein TraAM80_03553 [Trypanosoma rangeli]
MLSNPEVARGTVNFAAQNFQYQQQFSAPEQALSAAGRNWPRCFLLLSGISMGLVIASSIIDLITLSIGISTIFLNVYLIVLCFFALTAELRQVKCLRSLIYTWMKYLYFLTTYTGRAFFYIFLGTLAFGGGIWNYVAASVAVALGILMFFVNLSVELPKYVDPEVLHEEAGRREALGGVNQTPFFSTSGQAVTDRFSNATMNVSLAATTGYQPPGINEGPNAL